MILKLISPTGLDVVTRQRKNQNLKFSRFNVRGKMFQDIQEKELPKALQQKRLTS